MTYMLLIVEPHGQREARGEAGGREAYARMRAYSEDLKRRGLLSGAESLSTPGPEAARVQVREGRRRVLDGPFAETKEMVGGFYLLNVDSREQALEIAANCPAAEWCTVEVRRLAPCYE